MTTCITRQCFTIYESENFTITYRPWSKYQMLIAESHHTGVILQIQGDDDNTGIYRATLYTAGMSGKTPKELMGFAEAIIEGTHLMEAINTQRFTGLEEGTTLLLTE